jgi:hypothetical protein
MVEFRVKPGQAQREFGSGRQCVVVLDSKAGVIQATCVKIFERDESGVGYFCVPLVIDQEDVNREPRIIIEKSLCQSASSKSKCQFERMGTNTQQVCIPSKRAIVLTDGCAFKNSKPSNSDSHGETTTRGESRVQHKRSGCIIVIVETIVKH